MKRKLYVILVLALAVALLSTSCGAKSGGFTDNAGNSVESPGMPAPDAPQDPSESWDGEDWSGVVDSAGQAVKPTASLSEKIIYSATVWIETTDFEGAVRTVNDMLSRYGAFLESSSVSGRSYEAEYYGYSSNRTARYTIRVPAENFISMRDAMDDVGSVLNVETYSDNITQRYYDVQSRVDAYKLEQERLMELLGKCDSVSETIEVEARLSEVRYQLESYETTLRNWQNEVDYSTLDVTVNEVQEYTRLTQPNRSYWQQIGDGLKGTLEDIGSFFKNLFRDIVVALPILLIVAAVIAVTVAVIVHCVKKKSSCRGDSSDENEK